MNRFIRLCTLSVALALTVFLAGTSVVMAHHAATIDPTSMTNDDLNFIGNVEQMAPAASDYIALPTNFAMSDGTSTAIESNAYNDANDSQTNSVATLAGLATNTATMSAAVKNHMEAEETNNFVDKTSASPEVTHQNIQNTAAGQPSLVAETTPDIIMPSRFSGAPPQTLIARNETIYTV